VNSPPAGGLPITVVGDTLIAPPGFTSYQWYENLVLISGANDDTLIVTANGNYSVVYTDSTGCSNESITVLINTGMDEVDLSEWNFYPNPVSNILSFTGPKPGDILEINDMTGRIVFKTTVGDGNVNLASLDNGYYFIRIISDTGTSKPRGILKQ
jgi:hypothetical protein